MAYRMVIHKTVEYGGGQTSSMPQITAKKYLEKLVGSGTTKANLSQALNQAFDDKGKPTGDHIYSGNSVLHASAGVKGVSSVTLFYYNQAGTLHLFAMGEHKTSTSYKISYFGPATGTFKPGALVTI